MANLSYDWELSLQYIADNDASMADAIERCGFSKIEIKKHQNPFSALTRSIVYQQLSGRAAGTIHQRLLDLYPAKNRVTAENFLKLSEEQVRAAGISANKFLAITDLAEKTVDGFIPGYARLDKMDDQEVVDLLTEVRGIGPWTAEILLMFQLGRPDILPSSDLGIRKGFSIIKKLEELPTPKQLEQATQHWKPYRSVGSWYCWRATEL